MYKGPTRTPDISMTSKGYLIELPPQPNDTSTRANKTASFVSPHQNKTVGFLGHCTTLSENKGIRNGIWFKHITILQTQAKKVHGTVMFLIPKTICKSQPMDDTKILPLDGWILVHHVLAYFCCPMCGLRSPWTNILIIRGINKRIYKIQRPCSCKLLQKTEGTN